MSAKSAQQIAWEYGTNAQVMNRVFEKLGYLAGKPGEYVVTEKGLPFVTEYCHHQGLGGSPWYNRWWETRVWSDQFQEGLSNVKDLHGLISEATKECAADRAARKAGIAAQALAEEEARLAKETAEKAAEEAAARNAEILITIGKVTIVVLVIAGVAYTAYKVTPRVKKWWRKRKEKNDMSKKLRRKPERMTSDSADIIVHEVVPEPVPTPQKVEPIVLDTHLETDDVILEDDTHDELSKLDRSEVQRRMKEQMIEAREKHLQEMVETKKRLSRERAKLERMMRKSRANMMEARKR